MFDYFLAVQSPRTEGAILDAFRRAASGITFDRVRAAFAYASAGGAQLLHWSLGNENANWDNAQKRWLISFDWGHTDPLALEFLAGLEKSEVRIPRAEEVLTRRLVPGTCFHPKTAVFDRRASRNTAPASLIVGSANLTVSGLQTGYESASGAFWTTGRLSAAARDQLDEMRSQALELDAMWSDAVPLTAEILRRYSNLRRRRPAPEEDVSRDAKAFESSFTEMDFDRTAALAAATSFWIEVGHNLVENLGAGRPGNIFDLSRGSRAFFGFSGKRVPENTVLGLVRVRYGGGTYGHTMRFGDNSMDKLSLPLPGDEGPDEYEGTTLLFERRADGTFTMEVGSPADIRSWKRRSRTQGTLYRMRSGREYGVFS